MRLQERRDKSVDIIVSNLDTITHQYGISIKDSKSGPHDERVATIPANRREIVANFLLAL